MKYESDKRNLGANLAYYFFNLVVQCSQFCCFVAPLTSIRGENVQKKLQIKANIG